MSQEKCEHAIPKLTRKEVRYIRCRLLFSKCRRLEYYLTYCPNCFTRVKQGDHFCPVCGTKVVTMRLWFSKSEVILSFTKTCLKWFFLFCLACLLLSLVFEFALPVLITLKETLD